MPSSPAGIKQDICDLRENKGSVWAEPGVAGIWFHNPFCSQPSLLAHHPPRDEEGTVRGREATSPQGHRVMAWGATPGLAAPFPPQPACETSSSLILGKER